MRHELAIYAPEAAGLYEHPPRETGGAEVQTALLARALAARGLPTAHIVFPLRTAVPAADGGPVVVQRGAHHGALAVEARHVWSALERADARVYVFRMSSAALGVTALFCRLRRRGLVFAGANDYDFTFERLQSRPLLELYRFGVRSADVVVTQTSQQAQLARRAFPRIRHLHEIPSFAEPAASQARKPVAFLWTARLVDYKQPLRYLDLARALPEARFRMIAVETNETPRKLAADLARGADELPNLELLEPRGRGEVAELVDEAVAVVSTSRLEGMPNVFLEGWARGVPALSLDFDPDGRIAEHDLGVAAQGSFDRFVDGARALWTGRGDRRELAERTRAYIEATHSLEAIGARWADAVEEAARR